eukprot:5915122-Pyramimonas_sp.AAC.1
MLRISFILRPKSPCSTVGGHARPNPKPETLTSKTQMSPLRSGRPGLGSHVGSIPLLRSPLTG